MTSRIQEIAEASAKLAALYKRINETVRTRDRGPAERDRWSDACEEFHRRYPELFYPGGDESLDGLKRGESAAIATALDFLEADPMHFRSGYTKEEIWRRLRKAPLTATDKARLETTALRYLGRSIKREFWVMAQVMSRLGSEDFWRSAANLADAADEPGQDARFLFTSLPQRSRRGGAISQRAEPRKRNAEVSRAAVTHMIWGTGYPY